MAASQLNTIWSWSSTSTSFLKTKQINYSSSSSSSSSFVSFPHLTTTIINNRTLSSVSSSSSTSTLPEQLQVKDNISSSEEAKAKEAAPPPGELYVCNLPSTYDESQLLLLFKPFGTVQSLQISRNTNSGLSKGCAYVTMTSVDQAIAAVTALDASDVGGREMRVRFSKDMIRENNKYIQVAANKSLILESPHKIYVGNLAWSTKPHVLKQFFTQFGTVVSVRLLYDRKVGKNRVYAFLSFSSDEHLKSALSSDGMELLGRKLVVRNALKTSDPS